MKYKILLRQYYTLKIEYISKIENNYQLFIINYIPNIHKYIKIIR